MSRQHHEHPTQSVAPGAEPEQAGDNPSPQWVNSAQAAAAEFKPQPRPPTTGHPTTLSPATKPPNSQKPGG